MYCCRQIHEISPGVAPLVCGAFNLTAANISNYYELLIAQHSAAGLVGACMSSIYVWLLEGSELAGVLLGLGMSVV